MPGAAAVASKAALQFARHALGGELRTCNETLGRAETGCGEWTDEVQTRNRALELAVQLGRTTAVHADALAQRLGQQQKAAQIDSVAGCRDQMRSQVLARVSPAIGQREPKPSAGAIGCLHRVHAAAQQNGKARDAIVQGRFTRGP